jgi:hypothetical protein
MRFAAALFLGFLLWLSPAGAGAVTVGAFGDSITCNLCGDGSYLAHLDEVLGAAGIDIGTIAPMQDLAGHPHVIDEGHSASTTDGVLFFLNNFLNNGGTASALVFLTGTPDANCDGSFCGRPYDPFLTASNVAAMLEAASLAGIPAVLATPLPVDPLGIDNCSSHPASLTCAQINARLVEISGLYEQIFLGTYDGPDAGTDPDYPLLAGQFAFVDLYQAFLDSPLFASGGLHESDGLHISFQNGDLLIAQEIGDALIPLLVPEPGTGLLLGAGALVLAISRRR